MNYLSPAGVRGRAVTQLLGFDPRQAMHEDLIRLKSLLEEGETPTALKVVKCSWRNPAEVLYTISTGFVAGTTK